MDEYEIPVLEHGEEFEMLVTDEHPVWKSLHAIFVACKAFNALSERRQFSALWYRNQVLWKAEERALDDLVGYGFAQESELM